MVAHHVIKDSVNYHVILHTILPILTHASLLFQFLRVLCVVHVAVGAPQLDIPGVRPAPTIPATREQEVSSFPAFPITFNQDRNIEAEISSLSVEDGDYPDYPSLLLILTIQVLTPSQPSPTGSTRTPPGTPSPGPTPTPSQPPGSGTRTR